MSVTPSRTGRKLQRYHNNHRQVVGCIPYRYKNYGSNRLEVLVVSSPKNPNVKMFPKGGWETDESLEEAVHREAKEEAGVEGVLKSYQLGSWQYKSKSQDVWHQGTMFPLEVTNVLNSWAEGVTRNREWMSVKEAREACGQWWMKEALDKFVEWIANATTSSSSIR